MPPLPALPVTVKVRDWRQVVIEAYPELVTEDQNPIEYEFGGRRRVKRGFYKTRGPYAAT